MSSIQKNNAESTFQKVSIEDSFKILTHQNNTDEVEILTEETHRDFIQFILFKRVK